MAPTEPADLSICLIDDDPDHVILITRAIRDLGPGTRVQAMQDSTEAITWLRAQSSTPDLILLDINMPGLNGFDVLELVKADDVLKVVPVVMLTSSDLSSDVARAYQLGASGYISKPSYMHDLRAVLGNTLLYWSAMKRATLEGGQDR